MRRRRRPIGRSSGSASSPRPEGLSTHTARHSFADAARKKGDLYSVSKALGHGHLSTTQAYLADCDRADVDSLTVSLWQSE